MFQHAPNLRLHEQRQYATSLLSPLIAGECMSPIANVVTEWLLSFSVDHTGGGLSQLIEALSHHPEVVLSRIRSLSNHISMFNVTAEATATRTEPPLDIGGVGGPRIAPAPTDPFAALITETNHHETTTTLLQAQLKEVLSRVQLLSQQKDQYAASLQERESDVMRMQVMLETKDKELASLRKAIASLPAPKGGDMTTINNANQSHCTVCTYINELGASKCVMCGTSCSIGGLAPPSLKTVSTTLKLNEWECSICTFINNNLKSSKCEVCGSTNASSTEPPAPPALSKTPSSGKYGFDKALAESSCPICENAPQNAVYIPCGMCTLFHNVFIRTILLLHSFLTALQNPIEHRRNGTGHNASCIDCAEMIKKVKPQCPICNKVSSYIQFFPV
jgi:hypothetical protein